jgi:hypothetical protein
MISSTDRSCERLFALRHAGAPRGREFVLSQPHLTVSQRSAGRANHVITGAPNG